MRPTTDSELRKTTVLKFPLNEASAKIRTGGVNDDPEDADLPTWAGVVPLRTVRGTPEPSDHCSIDVPDYLK